MAFVDMWAPSKYANLFGGGRLEATVRQESQRSPGIVLELVSVRNVRCYARGCDADLAHLNSYKSRNAAHGHRTSSALGQPKWYITY